MKDTKRFYVQLFPFGGGKLRCVDVPIDELTNNLITNLDLVYKYGQNDFQPQNLPSVSKGDVIMVGTTNYIIKGMGFAKLRPETYNIMVKCLRKEKESKPSPETRYSNLMYLEFGKESFEYC